jgi:hypothetical protein
MARHLVHSPGSFFVLYFHLLLAALVVHQNSPVATAQSTPPVKVRIGVILNFMSPVGHRRRTGIQMGVEDYYLAHPGSATRVELHFRDSAGEVLDAASAGKIHQSSPASPSIQTYVKLIFSIKYVKLMCSKLYNGIFIKVCRYIADHASVPSSLSSYFLHF